MHVRGAKWIDETIRNVQKDTDITKGGIAAPQRAASGEFRVECWDYLRCRAREGLVNGMHHVSR